LAHPLESSHWDAKEPGGWKSLTTALKVNVK